MSTALSGTLLIVGDERAQCEALAHTLRDRGYDSVCASSGETALAILRGRAFDLLLTDLKMPGMDGIELLREALTVDPNLVGILMTGHGTIATAVEAMQSGALDYILKPFNVSAILPVLSRALAVRRLRVEKAELEHRLRERGAESEALNKELDAFAFSVSHDLRAPLRAVSGFAGILAEHHATALSPEGRELVDHIQRAGQQGEQLVEELLRFSRLGRQPLNRMSVNVTALVREVVDDLRREEPTRHIDVVVDDLPEVDADLPLLRQVFENLLSNAFKFTRHRDRAHVRIGSQVQSGETILFVADNGAGFDMRYASRLFGVFRRLHTHEQFAGTGVGLSLVQRIVQRHGGRVWAEAAVDEGATFYFTLGRPYRPARGEALR